MSKYEARGVGGGAWGSAPTKRRAVARRAAPIARDTGTVYVLSASQYKNFEACIKTDQRPSAKMLSAAQRHKLLVTKK